MSNITKYTVLVADDDEQVLRVMAFHLHRWGYKVVSAKNKGELYQQLNAEQVALLLLDLRFGEHDGLEMLSDLLRRFALLPIVMLTAHGSIENAVAAIKQGAYDYLTKPPDMNRLQVVVGHALEKSRLNQRIADLEKQLQSNPILSRPIWGNSPKMQAVRERIANVATAEATVLILGESGTGKELVARALHEQSQRKNGPFVPVNMAALPRELAESTLFGHEKGAYTGADQPRMGCCETAHRGTLFLDEIGEMEMMLQSKLLRFVQERIVQRVGAVKSTNVDVRIVSATNVCLEEQVSRGQFREDLFYRLDVVRIELPPLRERREDIPLLATRFVQQAAERNGKKILGFTQEALALLSQLDWPGNVRQLENQVERMVIFATAEWIDSKEIPNQLFHSPLNHPVMSGVSPMTTSSATPKPAGRDPRGAERRPGLTGPGVTTQPHSPSFSGFQANREMGLNGERNNYLPVAEGSAPDDQVAADFQDEDEDHSNRTLKPYEQVEKKLILETLERTQGNVSEAARLLGRGQATIYRKIKRYRISLKSRGRFPLTDN